MATAVLSTTPCLPSFLICRQFQVLTSVTCVLSIPLGGGRTARYKALLLFWSALLGERGLLSARPPHLRVMGGPRKTDQFIWSLSTVGNTPIYLCLDLTGYGLRHLGIIPSMVASHHQPLNRVHEPNVQTCSSSCTEQDYCCNDSVISRVKLTYLMTA